jgi:hypothetical protein
MKVPVSMRRDPRDLRVPQRRKQSFRGGARVMEAGDECQAMKTSRLRDASWIATHCFGSNFIATPFMQ